MGKLTLEDLKFLFSRHASSLSGGTIGSSFDKTGGLKGMFVDGSE